LLLANLPESTISQLATSRNTSSSILKTILNEIKITNDLILMANGSQCGDLVILYLERLSGVEILGVANLFTLKSVFILYFYVG
jgi:hypothetical protein